MTVGVGATAPNFELDGTEGTETSRRRFSLAEMVGAPVVLVFYPADASPVCREQLRTYTEGIGRFAEVGAQVLAISPQSVDSHEDFASEEGGFAFPMLSDSDQTVGETYGVLGPIGFYRRSTFVIDAKGVVRYAHRSTAGFSFRPVDELVEAVREAR